MATEQVNPCKDLPEIKYFSIGNGDHTRIARPFTKDSPKYYFTLGGLGGTTYALLFKEEHENGAGCWAMFKEREGAGSPFECIHFDIIKYPPGQMTGGEVLFFNVEDDDHDALMEAIRDAIVPALRRAFSDVPGKLGLINFQNHDPHDAGTAMFVYEDETYGTVMLQADLPEEVLVSA